MRKPAALFIMTLATLLLGGCASNMSSNVYSSGQAQKMQTVQEGTVVALAPVAIQNQDNPVGTIAGGLIGGIAGSHLGGGSGSDVGAIGGAVVGGILGSMTESELTRKNGINITIRLQNGQLVSVVQEVNANAPIAIGQSVLIYSQGNTSRVVPI